MSTDAQIAANRINAQASCGPRTAEGQARVALNAVSTGLYSSGDFIRPGEQDLYAQFCAGFRTELAPEGAIEETLAAEIIHAAWRMRRCSVIEAAMMPAQADEGADAELDPMLDRAQQSVDRARAAAHRIFHRAIAELRRVQTERRLPALDTNFQRNVLLMKRRRAERAWAANEASRPAAAKQSQSGPGPSASTGRNSPCTCGSGIKYKRCCGKGASAVLNYAA
jgi:hypothetical protein